MENVDISLSDKYRNALVVVGYNRIKSIQRLLGSLLNAHYYTEVPLVLCIDASGIQKLYDYIKAFEWPYGSKYVFIQEKRLGLKEHIFFCCGLSRYFKSVTILEDDLYVSPFFYQYVEQSVEKYGDNPHVAGISLYKNETNGFKGIPQTYLNNGYDVMAIQSTSTWGETFTLQMWENFRIWLEKWNQDFKSINIPQTIKSWDRAWSKYYEAYIVAKNKYFIYPTLSVSTNFSDAGEHAGKTNIDTNWQVELLYGNRIWKMAQINELVKYDTYLNIKNTVLGLPYKNIGIDLNGLREDIFMYDYLVSIRQLPYTIVHHYGIQLRPIELNVLLKIEGEGIYVYDMHKPSPNNHYNATVDSIFSEYYMRNMNIKLIINRFKRLISNKIRRYVGK